MFYGFDIFPSVDCCGNRNGAPAYSAIWIMNGIHHTEAVLHTFRPSSISHNYPCPLAVGCCPSATRCSGWNVPLRRRETASRTTCIALTFVIIWGRKATLKTAKNVGLSCRATISLIATKTSSYDLWPFWMGFVKKRTVINEIKLRHDNCCRNLILSLILFAFGHHRFGKHPGKYIIAFRLKCVPGKSAAHP